MEVKLPGGGFHPPEQHSAFYRAAINEILSPAGKEFRGWGACRSGPLSGGIRFEDVSLCYEPDSAAALEWGEALPCRKGTRWPLVARAGRAELDR